MSEEHELTLAQLVPIGLRALKVLQFGFGFVIIATFSYAGWMYGITNRVTNLEVYGSAGLRDYEAKQAKYDMEAAAWRGGADAKFDAIFRELQHIGQKLDKVVK